MHTPAMTSPLPQNTLRLGLGLSLFGLTAGPLLGSTQSTATAAAATTKSSSSKKTKTTTKKVASKSTTTVVKRAATGQTGATTPASPNVLVVVADDFGVDASPCYPTFGVDKPTMPTVEQLCRDGVVFENVTASPVCTPSRAAALTGKYGFRTKVGTVDDVLASDETTIFDAVASAPAPYATAAIGKWHLGGNGSDPVHPQSLGVQYFDGFLRGQVQDYRSWPRVTQGATTTSSVYTTTAFTDSAIEWTAKQTKPWFLWLSYNAPHTPFHLPQANLLQRASLNGSDSDIAQNPAPYYFAALEAMDTELGRLLRTMPTATRNNTVVVFMGDNGTPARVIQTPFSRTSAKGTIAEGGVHVPMIVSGAGVTDRGKRSTALVNGVDVFATVADIANAKVAGGVDGRSFRNQLSNAAAPGNRQFAYAELFDGSAVASPSISGSPVATTAARRGAAAPGGAPNAQSSVWSVRDSSYKLVHDMVTGAEQLFDLVNDPGETQPLPSNSTNDAIAAPLRNYAEQLRSGNK
jgi:arylsulfatase A-like enzyme